MQHARHLVDGVHIPHGDHSPFRHVGEQRNFGALFIRNRAIRAAQKNIRLDTDFAQLLGSVLGRLGLEFAGRCNPGEVAQVDKRAVVGAELEAHLAHSFEEGQRLDVAHGSADFDNRHVHRIRLAEARTAFDELLDFVGHMGNDLDCFAQVVTAALFVEHAFVNLTGGEVVGLAHARFNETLIVAKIQVSFCAVVGDEHLAVLQGRHGPGINVEVGVQLDEGDCQAPRFEDRSKGG